jgi:hypothetical protein
MAPLDRAAFLTILGYTSALAVAVALMLPDVVRALL